MTEINSIMGRTCRNCRHYDYATAYCRKEKWFFSKMHTCNAFQQREGALKRRDLRPRSWEDTMEVSDD